MAKLSSMLGVLGGLDRLPNFGETVFPWLNWKYTSFQPTPFAVKLGLSFYLWQRTVQSGNYQPMIPSVILETTRPGIGSESLLPPCISHPVSISCATGRLHLVRLYLVLCQCWKKSSGPLFK